jgi:hypothetical protein
MGLAACSPADAAAADAKLVVSVTVVDQCLLHSGSASASCTGGAVYALGIGRETVSLAKSDVLTTADENAHTSGNGSPVTAPQFVFGGAGGLRGQGYAPDAVRTVAATAFPLESIRITYSF